jgi:hypothetical protein
MYHSIDDLIAKVNVIKMKSDDLRDRIDGRAASGIPLSDAEIQFEIDDIQALCADIANDRQTQRG